MGEMKKVGDVLDEHGSSIGEVWASTIGVIDAARDKFVEPVTARSFANLLKRAAIEVEGMRERAAKVAAIGGSR